MAVIPSREYTILLTHLHKPSSSLPLSTHQSLISHFLAQTPTPTQLTATVISSPLFRPFSHTKLVTLVTAFRHAIHLRLKTLEDEEKTLFTRGTSPRMAEWVRGLVKGFKGGQAVIRFVSVGGILLGLDDLIKKLGADLGSGSVRAKVEDELIVALSEIVELYGASKDSAWEKEFQPETEQGELDALSLALLFAAQFLPHVFSERIKVLPLSALSSHLVTRIEATFASGSFLASLPSSCSTTPDGKLSLATPVRPTQPSFPYDGPWSRSTPLSVALNAVIGSPLFTAVPSLAGITARVLPLLAESSPLDGWNTLEMVAAHLERVTSNVENHWEQSALANIENEDDVDPQSRQIATNIWTVLKTLLFTTIMLSQSLLSTITYSHPLSSTVPPLESSRPFIDPPTHSSLSLSILRTLSHLSFVITKFGGVTSTSSSGLAELKRVFYSALDILGADAEASETFVKALDPHVSTASSSSAEERPADALTRSRQAFNLTCAEQLVPLLSLDTIEHRVFPLCLPHLYDSSHRETYESAHSVILSIFASQTGSTTVAEVQDTGVSRPTFVEKIVPFYARCLLENSARGKLTTAQLRLAYSALTSSAGGDAPAMGQFCLSSLLSALSDSSATTDDDGAQRRHRLRLVLVSTLSALPPVMLPEALNAVSDAMRDSEGEEQRELAKEVFKEIMENVGDREKEYCLRWWEGQRHRFEGVAEVANGKGKGRAREALSARM